MTDKKAIVDILANTLAEVKPETLSDKPVSYTHLTLPTSDLV